eukprot:m51a1_g9662 hypothetical protein (297) ;mRNA; r:1224510-1225400
MEEQQQPQQQQEQEQEQEEQQQQQQQPLYYVFEPPLTEGLIDSRPNRFIVLATPEGASKPVRCHCPCTGRIGTLRLPGRACLLSRSSSSGKRATDWTVEAVAFNGGWLGVNQTAVNRYVEHYLRSGQLPRLLPPPAEGSAGNAVQRERRVGQSRLDFEVGTAGGTLLIEVKTPLELLPPEEGEESAGPAPKRARTRAARKERKRSPQFFVRLVKHLTELQGGSERGDRAALVLCFVRGAAAPFAPPDAAGEDTSAGVREAVASAVAAGVEMWQINLELRPDGVRLVDYFELDAASW